MKPEYIPLLAALLGTVLGALVSLLSVWLQQRVQEGRERRKFYWEKEFDRFADLEVNAGRLVEDLLSYNTRSEDERASVLQQLQNLRDATGRFLRYPAIAGTLRDFNHAAGWFFSQDMKHETPAESNEARSDVTNSFNKLIAALDETLRSAPKRL